MLGRQTISLSSLHGLFKGSDEPFNCAIRGRMVWCRTNVSDAISTHKVSKFTCGEVRTIIRYQLIGQVKRCKNASQDDNGLLRGGRTHPDNLWPFRMSVNNKKEHLALEQSYVTTVQLATPKDVVVLPAVRSLPLCTKHRTWQQTQCQCPYLATTCSSVP